MMYLYIFGMSLLLTLIFEMAVAYLFRISDKKGMLLVVLVNVLTNPVAVFINLCGTGFAWWDKLCQVPIEIVVIIIEAWIYYLFSKKEEWNIARPVLLSVCANIFSYGMGCLIELII